MAPNGSATSVDAAVDFNRINLALARRQGLLASLMGVGYADKAAQKHVAETALEEGDSFTADPELLGIGGKIPHDDEVERQKLSSNDHLKRQLLGSDYDKRKRVNRHPATVQQDVPALRTTVVGNPPLRLPPQNLAVDSDEDAGRSSLGKRKRNNPSRAEEVTMSREEAGEGKEERTLSNHKELVKTEMASSGQVNTTYLDEVLAERSTRKRKKKKKKSKKKFQ